MIHFCLTLVSDAAPSAQNQNIVIFISVIINESIMSKWKVLNCQYKEYEFNEILDSFKIIFN